MIVIDEFLALSKNISQATGSCEVGATTGENHQ
jgi:hypothetical protein